MIGYVMVGTNDLPRAQKFFDGFYCLLIHFGFFPVL